jgi:hypothetical protein
MSGAWCTSSPNLVKENGDARSDAAIIHPRLAAWQWEGYRKYPACEPLGCSPQHKRESLTLLLAQAVTIREQILLVPPRHRSFFVALNFGLELVKGLRREFSRDSFFISGLPGGLTPFVFAGGGIGASPLALGNATACSSVAVRRQPDVNY